MVVVSNTSPLSNLAIIGRLSLLEDQLGEILVPAAVRGELEKLKNDHGRLLLDKAFSEGWLKVTPLKNPVPG